MSQCGAANGTPGSSNQELFAQNFNGLVADVDAATFWNGNQYAESLTCTSDRQLMPDKGRLQCVVETPIVPNDQGGSVMQVENDGNSGTLRANTHGNEQIVCYDARGNGNGDVSPTATGDHLNRITDYTPIVHKERIGYYPSQHQCPKQSDTPTLTTDNCSGVRGDTPLVQECYSVDRRNQTTVAIGENIISRQPHNGGNYIGVSEELAFAQNTSGVMGVANSATVRRLLPIECERLMAFPDNWTRIPWKGKPAEDCPDSPRYKACGNSMCVNVMRWLGLRIELVERRTQK